MRTLGGMEIIIFIAVCLLIGYVLSDITKKKCPACREKIESKAVICSRCGTDLRTPAA